MSEAEAPPPQPSPRKPWAMIISLVALAVVALGAAMLLAPPGRDVVPPPPKPERIEGGPLHAQLNGLVVGVATTLGIHRALKEDDTIMPTERLMFRARLTGTAFLAMLAQKNGSAPEPIWPSSPEQKLAGEFEIDEGETPLTIDPSLFGAGVRFTLVACPSQLEVSELCQRARSSKEAPSGDGFPRCSLSALQVGQADAGSD